MMKKLFFVRLITLLFLAGVVLTGCGGSKTVRVKGIDERQSLQPAKPDSPEFNVNRRAFSHFANGSIFETIGEFYLANQQYKEALKYYPNSQEIRFAYAVTSFKIGNFDTALIEARKLSPRDVRAWLLIGDCYRIRDDVDSALYAYKKVVELDTANFEVYFQIAQYYERREQLDSAVAAFKKVTLFSPSFQTYQQLGNLQMRARMIDAAKESYLNSIALDSGSANVRSYIGLSVIHEENGDTIKAKNYIKMAADRAPQDFLIHARLLGFYEKDREYAKAIETAKHIIVLAPMDRNIPSRLGILYYNVDSLQKADSIFTDLISLGEDNVINRYYAGRTAYFMKNYKKAKEHFTRVTFLSDSILDGWINLAMTYRALDSTRMEIAVYRSGLTHMTNLDDSTGLMFSLAVALERDSLIELSVETFERIIKRIPDHGPSLNYLGYMLADRGERLEYALELIKKAVGIDPENGAYIDSYGWVLYKLGQYKKALEQLKNAYSQIDDDPVVLDHLAEAYRALGDTVSAREYWNKALEHDPDNTEIMEKLGR